MEYNQHNINFDDLANKLFCTFTVEQGLDDTLEEISSKYQILFNKIFVLYKQSTNEYVCTYNVDSFNVTDYILPSTILLHRKKESNTISAYVTSIRTHTCHKDRLTSEHASGYFSKISPKNKSGTQG